MTKRYRVSIQIQVLYQTANISELWHSPKTFKKYYSPVIFLIWDLPDFIFYLNGQASTVYVSSNYNIRQWSSLLFLLKEWQIWSNANENKDALRYYVWVYILIWHLLEFILPQLTGYVSSRNMHSVNTLMLL